MAVPGNARGTLPHRQPGAPVGGRHADAGSEDRSREMTAATATLLLSLSLMAQAPARDGARAAATGTAAIAGVISTDTQPSRPLRRAHGHADLRRQRPENRAPHHGDRRCGEVPVHGAAGGAISGWPPPGRDGSPCPTAPSARDGPEHASRLKRARSRRSRCVCRAPRSSPAWSSTPPGSPSRS